MAVLLTRLMLQPSIGRCFRKYIAKPAPAPLSPTASTPKLLYLTFTKAFSTTEDSQEGKKQKRKDAFTNTGRKISERIIRVLDEKGSDLGMMHRADVIRLMDQQDLRLVKKNTGSEPPEYQLMTGAQIHQERLRLREGEKANPKTGPAVVKEVIFSSNIGQHDLDTKSKQIQQWIEKRYHVQVTIKKKKSTDQLENEMDEVFNQILQTMPGLATFSSRPKAVRGGSASTCVFRPLSKKEEKAYRDSQEPQRRNTSSKDHRTKESDVLCQ
ncbi:translation initiation factor IF-3, mitochondrial [Onychomys torridus]|uniref:translation initiation factor IF-3, mitochondrial n=1 Tax=Onychomys torridus TaxID=38674 RepID=UPI00167F2F1E|nr:translation initiation factor IF-3, mitochondrial [Onychomys torridus]XP_036028130.1 translation initiation factor IF-3, mitochondrial [Onychomys torridus]XP_036028131.1 translation initiation factor IF-3, mitochondrial [Onychomys torridus]XP_036028132.1 translation initiation factor IF-3, mitochondrial [Onychomys torridus]XP_036028133.1 translation initiation factor IF-3, mitochondrial [Onychomys torridus]